jgi:hypothetical protein
MLDAAVRSELVEGGVVESQLATGKPDEQTATLTAPEPTAGNESVSRREDGVGDGSQRRIEDGPRARWSSSASMQRWHRQRSPWRVSRPVAVQFSQV